jgi:hypothetical protein
MALFGFQKPKLLVGKKTIVNIGKHAKIMINGRLDLSVNQFTKSITQLRVIDGGELIINGVVTAMNGTYIDVGKNAKVLSGKELL